jgi:peptidoglycan/LPS O-acetylase OafA/YrhL
VKANERTPALDGVRALAITMVVLYHVLDIQGLPAASGVGAGILRQMIGAGWLGVPLFFTLSGFLVGGRIVASQAAGTFRFGRFYFDRSMRILPIAFVYLVLYGLRADTLGWNAWTIANFAYVSNRFGIETPLHFWSLQIEEQFYMVTPLLLAFVAGKVTVSRMTIAIVVSWVLRVVLLYTHPAADPYRDGFNYIDCFLAGTLASMLSSNLSLQVRAHITSWTLRRGVPEWFPLVASLVLYVPLSFAAVPVGGTSPITEPFAISVLYPLVCAWTFAVVLLTAVGDNGVTKLFSCKPAQLVAVLSYSIYVWHTDLMVGFKLDAGASWAAQLLVDFVVVGLAAVLSYFVIEKPFLWLRDEVRRVQRVKSVKASLKAAY